MDYQADSYVAGFRIKAETDIECKQNGLMERMKPDTATPGIIDGVSQKMVKIHQHGAHHQEIGFPPLRTKKNGYNSSWNQEMQYQMKSNFPALTAGCDSEQKSIVTPAPIFPELWRRVEYLPFRNCLHGKHIHTVALQL